MTETRHHMDQQGAKDIAARVRAARAWADLDQAVLATAMHYKTRTWARVEAGEKSLTRDEREAVADICRVPRVFLEQGFRMLAEADLERRLAELADDLAALRRSEEEPPEEPDSP